MDTCLVRAPCSTANLGPGYDVFGLALDALFDKVRLTKSSTQGISIRVSGSDTVPSRPEANSAGRVVSRMCKDYGIESGIEIEVEKGIPAGYGMGSSGASSAATALAFKTLFELTIDDDKLVELASEGELASAGSKHYDNVSASLLGGFVICHISSRERISFIRLAPPNDLCLVVAVPRIPVPERKTQVARSVLPKEVPLKSVVHNISAASAIVAGFATADVKMIAGGIDDIIVEPARKGLIKGYSEVKESAICAGALAVTISGAGPSLIAILESDAKSDKVASAMQRGFLDVGQDSRTYECRTAVGAQVL